MTDYSLSSGADSRVIPAATALIVAIVCPTLITFNLAPSSTFFNQVAALAGWGIAAIVIAMQVRVRATAWRPVWLLLVPLALLVASAIASILVGYPSTLGLSAVGTILAAIVVLLVGAGAGASPSIHGIFRGFCLALLTAGLVGGVLGCVQVFVPEWSGGDWIAAMAGDGRASSNLRQPNHLSSLLVWSLVAMVWMWQSDLVHRVLAAGLCVFLVFAIVLTGSRTGLLDVILLAAWGLLDRRLPKSARLFMLVMPLVYGAGWWGLREWAHTTGNVFGGEARMGAQADISSSRYAIWSDTLALVAQHPWTGVGFGEFNFAWSLTPFPHRPVAFFDHTHNIILQFAVELGIPMALLILSFMTAALFTSFRNSWRAHATQASSIGRTASMVVLMISVHSMFEYPLWYSYFLLPCAFAFGVALSIREPESGSKDLAGPATGYPKALAAAGSALLMCSVLAFADYMRVVPIFESGDGVPLSERIESGRRSMLFGYQADYAAATTADSPSNAMASFRTATHNLLDTRLMIAWSKAYAERGDLERARHIAQRLREFKNADAAAYFAPCDSADPPAGSFQCQRPASSMDYRDFR
ncbi:O-antigen ligase family protein [Piscinibacter terrae]|uniref:O-antigen ligase family protein n=1 Tax=Piscinibacter terrae TaxID=2496871 RepID=A0A3N7K0F2_9BURK|nr:O-antigen ligase family protein [Albitalea terrae]RQP24495.1 O-antigen ligase family protein [Albitalea terrae]